MKKSIIYKRVYPKQSWGLVQASTNILTTGVTNQAFEVYYTDLITNSVRFNQQSGPAASSSSVIRVKHMTVQVAIPSTVEGEFYNVAIMYVPERLDPSVTATSLTDLQTRNLIYVHPEWVLGSKMGTNEGVTNNVITITQKFMKKLGPGDHIYLVISHENHSTSQTTSGGRMPITWRAATRNN